MKAQARYSNFSFMAFAVMTSSERMTIDIIGRHFTANRSIYLFIKHSAVVFI